MKVKELIIELQKLNPENEIVVPVVPLHVTMGGTPSLKIVMTYDGFDWDSGTSFIQLKEDVRSVDRSYQDQMRHLRSVDEHNYAIRQILTAHNLEVPERKKR